MVLGDNVKDEAMFFELIRESLNEAAMIIAEEEMEKAIKGARERMKLVMTKCALQISNSVRFDQEGDRLVVKMLYDSLEMNEVVKKVIRRDLIIDDHDKPLSILLCDTCQQAISPIEYFRNKGLCDRCVGEITSR